MTHRRVFVACLLCAAVVASLWAVRADAPVGDGLGAAQGPAAEERSAGQRDVGAAGGSGEGALAPSPADGDAGGADRASTDETAIGPRSAAEPAALGGEPFDRSKLNFDEYVPPPLSSRSPVPAPATDTPPVAPPPPGGDALEVSAAERVDVVTLSWSDTPGVDRYHVAVDGVAFASTSATEFVLPWSVEDESYVVSVSAVSADGVALSGSVQVRRPR